MYQLVDFQDVVANLGYGKTSRELMENLTEIVQAVRENGGKGVLTLRIEVTVNKLNAIIISDKITAKKPEAKRQPIDLEPGKNGDLFLIDDPEVSMPIHARAANGVQVGTVRFDSTSGEILDD